MNAVMKNPGQLRMMCYKAEIVLGIEAWYFLHGTTGGVCNLFYFLSLLSKMQTVNVQLGKRGQHYTVKAGQADGSLLGLSREWRIGRAASVGRFCRARDYIRRVESAYLSCLFGMRQVVA